MDGKLAILGKKETRMNAFKHIAFLAFSSLALFSINACTTTSGTWLDDPFNNDFDNLAEDQKELVYNGFLLQSFYVNASTELRDADVYDGKGASHGFSPDDYEYPDVSYMYSTINDNYTNYYSPRIADRIVNLLTYSETAIGIGAKVKPYTSPSCAETDETCSDSVTVFEFSQVYKGGPAEAAGIKKGDIVVSVNGTVPNTVDAFDKLTTGQEGEKITLEISRDGDSREIVITLAPYISPTVFVDDYKGIPVITISEFTDTTTLASGTYGEFLEALEETDGAPSTIIDLRGNPGGSVDHCLNISAELVSKNDTLVTIIEHGLDEDYEPVVDTVTYTADSDGLGKGRYYVFLADTGSASCAEIMLAGVAHNTKSPIVGMVTYGKGIGQSYLGTYAGGIAGITSMRIMDKYGKSYHRFGFAPDYEEADPDKALEKAYSLAEDATAVGAVSYGTTDLGHFTLQKSQRGNKSPKRGGAFKILRKPIAKPAPLK